MACLVLWLSSFEDNRVIQLVIMTLFVNLKFPINVKLEYYIFFRFKSEAAANAGQPPSDQ